jgi:hypothetical protein
VTEDGRLISVSKTTLGTTLAADATSGDGSVTLTDTTDFDEDGGTLQIGGSTYVYVSVDPDSGVAVLASTLSADAGDGDRVDVWDVGLGQVAEEGRALVALPGGLANDEPIDADIAHSLLAFLDDGLRAPGTEEAVRMVREGDSWTVTDVRGKKAAVQPASGRFVVAANDPVSIAEVDPGGGFTYRAPMYSGAADTVVAFGVDGDAFPQVRIFAESNAGIYWGDGTVDPTTAGYNLWLNQSSSGVELDSSGSSVLLGQGEAFVDLAPADGAPANVFIRVDEFDAQIHARASGGQSLPLLELAATSGDPMLTVMQDGEVEIYTAGGGIVMASPDGTRYRLTVANGGTLDISAA